MPAKRDEIEVIPTHAAGTSPRATLRISGVDVPASTIRVISSRQKRTNLTSYREQVEDLEAFLTRVAQSEDGTDGNASSRQGRD